MGSVSGRTRMIAAASLGIWSAGILPALSAPARMGSFISVERELRSRWRTGMSALQLRPAEPFTIARSPRIAAHVVTALFPEARLIFGEEAHAFDPLRGFPGVQLRND